ncbi:hypothetical protein [Emticicia sp. 17c]|uniref:hypothetical protein n=1 Tax=Emticicia sp. 17c TaxID=3127704 RepID=UPI00301E2757
MSIFEFIKGFNREVAKEIGKHTIKFAVKKMAEPHQGKKYKAYIFNKDGEVECELLITPKTNNYVAALGNLVKERVEFQSGKVKIDIQLIPDCE